jgi:hypothetical protein
MLAAKRLKMGVWGEDRVVFGQVGILCRVYGLGSFPERWRIKLRI